MIRASMTAAALMLALATLGDELGEVMPPAPKPPEPRDDEGRIAAALAKRERRAAKHRALMSKESA